MIRTSMLKALLLTGSMVLIAAASAQSAITYQGQLENSQGPVTDTVSMTFSLWDAAVGGSEIASEGPVSVDVVDGLFQVALDFGSGAFGSGERFLAIEVEGELLGDRQAVSAVPVALTSLDAGDGFWQEISSGNISYTGGRVTVGSGLLSRFGINAAAGELVMLARAGGQTALRVNENLSVSVGANYAASGIADGGLRVAGASEFADDLAVQGGLQVQNDLNVQGESTLAGQTSIGSLSSPQRLGVGTDSPWNALHVVAAEGEGPLRVMVGDNSTTSAVIRGYPNRGVAIGNSYVDDDVPERGLIVRGEVHVRDLPWRGSDPISNLCPEPINGGPVWRLVRCMADSSSIRYKEEVETLEGSAELVRALRPVRYRWKDSGREDIGLVAEEVDQVIPGIVLRDEEGEIQGFRYNRLGALLIGAFQELERNHDARLAQLDEANARLVARLEATEAELDEARALARRNAELERRLAAVEQLLGSRQAARTNAQVKAAREAAE